MSYDGEDHILEFRVKNGFSIDKLAKKIVDMMTDTSMDAILYIPGGVSFEIEKECTMEEIVDGYKNFIKKKISNNKPSNANEKPELKPV